jgi:hypothetical protein
VGHFWSPTGNHRQMFFVYYEEIKRELKREYLSMSIYDCRCNEKLKVKNDGSTRHSGLLGELEHLKIETRLIGENFVCVWWVSVWSRIYRCVVDIQDNPSWFIPDENVDDLRFELWGEHPWRKWKLVCTNWNPKSWNWGIYTTHIHWVVRGTGKPKDRDEVKNKSEI